jgi:hypothetical protein
MQECHLLFDLEYYRKFNADQNWDAMMDNLLDLVEEKLERRFSARLFRDNIVELDATSSGEVLTSNSQTVQCVFGVFTSPSSWL